MCDKNNEGKTTENKSLTENKQMLFLTMVIAFTGWGSMVIVSIPIMKLTPLQEQAVASTMLVGVLILVIITQHLIKKGKL